ncbi:hypothetical protein G9P44_004980 [Scheffersomyces stipitis]|nr:hypothetical protein G9P44_004980 [Scheffersomyces stipitis]
MKQNQNTLSEYEDEEVDIYEQITINKKKKKQSKLKLKQKNNSDLKIKLKSAISKAQQKLTESREQSSPKAVITPFVTKNSYYDDNEYDPLQAESKEALLSQQVESMNTKLLHKEQETKEVKATISKPLVVPDTTKPEPKVTKKERLCAHFLLENFNTNNVMITNSLKARFAEYNSKSIHLFHLFLYNVKNKQERFFDPSNRDMFIAVLCQLTTVNEHAIHQFNKKFVKENYDITSNCETDEQATSGRKIESISIPYIVYKRLGITAPSPTTAGINVP